MTLQNVKETLRQQRKQLLAEQKKRSDEITALYQDQQLEDRLDRVGALWGEKQFSALPGADDMRPTDIEAKYVPDFRNPERIAIIEELWSLVAIIVQEAFGEDAYKLFLEWLTGSTVAELAEEKDVAFTALLTQIKSMVAACREMVGEDPEIFPFQERTDPNQTKRINMARGLKRLMAGKSKPADEAGRIILTEAERQLSLDPLWEQLKSKGYNISRSAAWRAKRLGWFHPDFKASGLLTAVGVVYLTEEEKGKPGKALADLFGITPETAFKSRKRGFFVVNVNNKDRVKIPEGRLVQYDPQKGK